MVGSPEDLPESLTVLPEVSEPNPWAHRIECEPEQSR